MTGLVDLMSRFSFLTLNNGNLAYVSSEHSIMVWH